MTCLYTYEETKGFAKSIYNYILKENIKIVFLKGELGVGKTTFITQLLESKETNPVSSPTYNYMNEYTIDNRHIWHFDLYRLEDQTTLLDLGILDYLYRDDGIAFVEWPEKIDYKSYSGTPILQLNFQYIKDTKKRACIVSLI